MHDGFLQKEGLTFLNVLIITRPYLSDRFRYISLGDVYN